MSHNTAPDTEAFARLLEEHSILLDNVQVIAFDIFDTLLYRTISPEQVHDCWAAALLQENKRKLTTGQVLRRRRIASRLAKIPQILRGRDRECHYAAMIRWLWSLLYFPGSYQRFLCTCLRLEQMVEQAVEYVPEDRRRLFDAACATGKTVICISDFYLPESLVRALLQRQGLIPSAVYVSESYALQKRTGKLYKKVAQSLNCPPDRILMIGDNPQSDDRMARESGLRAIWLSSDDQHMVYRQQNLRQQTARRAFYDHMQSSEVRHHTTPFLPVTFLLVLWMQRLYRQLRKDQCRQVLFMSREGEMLKRLFDEYQSRCIPKEHQITTRYFYVSRKATLLPAIHTIQKDSFGEIYKNYPNMSITTFLRNLGLENDGELLSELRSQFDLDAEISQFPFSLEYETLLQSKQFCRKIMEKATGQRVLFLQYLEQMGIDAEQGGIFLVDIGYSGTSQNHIYRIFNGKATVRGYYLISTPQPETVSERNQKTGLLYDALKPGKKDAFAYNPVILETLLLASHGGVIAYQKGTNGVEPVFHTDPREVHCYQTTILPIQKIIEEEFSQLVSWLHEANLSENDYYGLFLREYKRFIYNPSRAEIEQYLSTITIDNFSAFHEKQSALEMKGTGRAFSLKNFLLLCKTRGWCLNQQNTNWMAAAFYQMDLRLFNTVLQLLSGLAMKIYDFATKSAVQRRQKGQNRI